MINLTKEEARLGVGAGWEKLVDAIYDRLPDDAFISDIKEKLGGLSVSVYGVDWDTLQFIEEMEDKSFEVCEVCGEPGKPRGGVWIKTLCEEHWVEQRLGRGVVE